jgi:hypothetical protein
MPLEMCRLESGSSASFSSHTFRLFNADPIFRRSDLLFSWGAIFRKSGGKDVEEKVAGPPISLSDAGRFPQTCSRINRGASQLKHVHTNSILPTVVLDFIAASPPSPNKLLYSILETHTLTRTYVSLCPIFGFVHYLMALSVVASSDSSGSPFLDYLQYTRSIENDLL